MTFSSQIRSLLILGFSLFFSMNSSCSLFIDIKDPPDTLCGNGVIDTGEECDNTHFAGKTCENIGYASGEITCSVDCIIDTSSCVTTELCGNGIIDSEEECDGSALNNETCESKGYINGELSCNEDCTFNISVCTGTPVCGDGEVGEEEECDGSNLNSSTCNDFGYENGYLLCDSNCNFDTSNCIATCGNGILEQGETCDDGFTDNCGTCNADCSGPGLGSICGDGVICPETEVCDDSFTDECGTCNANCSGPGIGMCGDGYCGNGFLLPQGVTTISLDSNVFTNSYNYFTPQGGQVAYQAHGKDIVIGIFLNSGDYLLAKVHNINFDVALYLLSNCSPTANDSGLTYSNFSPSAHGEQLHFQATSDGTYYLVIDGYMDNDNGSFDVDIYTGSVTALTRAIEF